MVSRVHPSFVRERGRPLGTKFYAEFSSKTLLTHQGIAYTAAPAVAAPMDELLIAIFFIQLKGT